MVGSDFGESKKLAVFSHCGKRFQLTAGCSGRRSRVAAEPGRWAAGPQFGCTNVSQTRRSVAHQFPWLGTA